MFSYVISFINIFLRILVALLMKGMHLIKLILLFQVLVHLHHPHCNASFLKETKTNMLISALARSLKYSFIYPSEKFWNIL